MYSQLSRIQFDILTTLETDGKSISQRELASRLEKSVGTINKAISSLTELGYIENGRVTRSGINALEPYRVKRAVFIAAGFGTRLVPVTLNTPKPLVRVNGKRIIDTLIDAVLAAGIHEIYIVRGYLAEQFDQLLYKYPMIKFIENPAYNEANNISSAVCARYLLSGAYVFEADLYLSNPSLIKKYHYSSNFLGIRMERTDDWCFETKDDIIQKQMIGGFNCFQEIGISYWSETDGIKLAEHLKVAYEMPGGKELYWDQVPLLKFADDYSIEVRECYVDDVVEIDSFKELKQIDKSYNV